VKFIRLFLDELLIEKRKLMPETKAKKGEKFAETCHSPALILYLLVLVLSVRFDDSLLLFAGVFV
jgi:hypothetical protein